MPKTKPTPKMTLAHSLIIGIAIICFSLMISSFLVLIRVGLGF